MNIYIDFQLTSQKQNINLDNLFKRKGKGHRIGDCSIRGNLLDYSQWSLDFPPTPIETVAIEDVAKVFLAEFERVESKLINYIEETASEAHIYFVVQYDEGEDLMTGLSKESIMCFAKLKASISIDGLYLK